MYATQHNTAVFIPARSSPSAVLTRELLASDGAEALVINEAPRVPLLTSSEREESLASFMKFRPAGDIWVFAYGSLIWNPAMRVAEARVAHIEGWHRSFCLSTEVGRGTPMRPGLVLGLDVGGSCHGVAYRIADCDAVSELSILWNREMLLGGYIPAWIDAIGTDGHKIGTAIAFMIDRSHPNYAGWLPEGDIIDRLATAAGSWGSSADYLFRTVEGLRRRGIRDLRLERMRDLVDEARSAGEEQLAA